MPRPDFIIIGAMKCATSTLHEQLARQPGFFMSTPKEPNFFSDDDVHGRGAEWYRRLFVPAAPGDLCGESSTHYTKLPTFPRTIDRMINTLGLDLRLVYVLRHPIERHVSQFVHEWSQRTLNCSIDEAVLSHPELVEYSRYGMQIAPYIDRFGSRRILPLYFERIRSNPQPEFERLGRFLGARTPLRWDHEMPAQNVSSERPRKGPWRDALVKSPLLTALRRRFVPEAVRNRIKSRWRMEHRPTLSAASIARLKPMFDDDLARLEPWIGARLTCDSYLTRVCGPVTGTREQAA